MSSGRDVARAAFPLVDKAARHSAIVSLAMAGRLPGGWGR